MQDSYFDRQECLGRQAEALVLQYLVGRGYKAKKVNHETHPFDIGVQTGSGKKFRIEVKVYGAPHLETIFAETVQISPKLKIQSTPEYLTYYDNIEYMMYVDLRSKIAYVYDMPKFATYVLANKHKAEPIGRGTAMGIRIHQTDKEAGYLSKIPLNPS